MTPRDLEAIKTTYHSRKVLLDELAKSLDTELRLCLSGVDNIDRISFRTKGVDSFVAKAETKTADGNEWKYEHPFEEIEDQVALR